MTYSYSSNLPQVQPVREVTFREYAIDPSSKWHPRNNLPHCYSAEEIMHRDCLPATNTASMGEMFGKNTANVYHPSTNVSSNFYSTVGRNGVLPQAFDQFFETAYAFFKTRLNSDFALDKVKPRGYMEEGACERECLIKGDGQMDRRWKGDRGTDGELNGNEN
ncbi:Hoxa11 [Columba livia]|nr:Hoxa11 [Columba livia]